MSYLIYEITAVVKADAVGEYERYMLDRHIPDLMATGCFARAEIAKTGNSYRIRYYASSRKVLDRYLSDHAPRLREDMLRHFPDGVTVAREEWELIKTFGSSG